MYTENDFDFFSKSAFIDSALLHTFLRLKIPTYLSAAPHEGLSVAQLSASLQVNEQGLRVFVEVLNASNILSLNDQQHMTLHPEVQAVLTNTEALARLQSVARWWEPAQQLTTAVRTGEPIQTPDGQTWDLLEHYAALFLASAPEEDPAFQRVFDRVARNFLRTQLLACVAQLHLLPCFYQQEQTLSLLQEHCHASQKGLTIVLAILVKFGLLQQQAGVYSFAPYFKQRINKLILKAYSYSWSMSAMFWEAFGDLEKNLLTGETRVFDLQNPATSNTFYRELAKYNTLTFPAYYRITRQVATRISQLKPLQHSSILDVGAGSGAWGAGFITVEPTAQVALLDQALVMPQAKAIMEKLNLGSHVQFRIDDVRTADYGEHCFDVIILGFVCHTQPLQNLPDLFARLGRALRPGGLLLIADWCLNEQHTGPLDLLYFSLKEFVTTQGALLSITEYKQMLDTVGLKLYVASQIAGFDLLLVGHHHTEMVIPQDFSW
jgi:SAM-dependent methyltransferase